MNIKRMEKILNEKLPNSFITIVEDNDTNCVGTNPKRYSVLLDGKKVKLGFDYCIPDYDPSLLRNVNLIIGVEEALICGIIEEIRKYQSSKDNT